MSQNINELMDKLNIGRINCRSSLKSRPEKYDQKDLKTYFINFLQNDIMALDWVSIADMNDFRFSIFRDAVCEIAHNNNAVVDRICKIIGINHEH